MPYYNDRTAHKMRMYHKHNLNAVFIYFNGRGSLEEMIAGELKDLGVEPFQTDNTSAAPTTTSRPRKSPSNRQA
jgi:hypothetical protein